MALSDFGIHIDTKGFLKAHIDGNSGHTFSSSIEELIHNSIDAEANNIYILKDKYGSLIIVDDGIGMDNNNIKNLAVMHKHEATNKNIGKYGIGLKDALFCLGKKWFILSKKNKKIDLECACFDIDLAHEYINSPDKLLKGNIIQSGGAARNKELTNFKDILKQLSYKNYKDFSGTILIQESEKNLHFEDTEDVLDFNSKLEENFNILINQLKFRLMNKSVNIFYGNYIINYNQESVDSEDDEENQKSICIEKASITKIDKFDWLSWKNKTPGQFIEFNIYTFSTKSKSERFIISYQDNLFMYCKKNGYFKQVDDFNKYKIEKSKGIINIKINILKKNLHNKQLKFYESNGYYDRLNGIIVSRNGLDLYTYPNEWIIYKSNNRYSENVRFYTNFEGNEFLDNLFGIKTNKSLFKYNMLNNTLSNMIDFINNSLYYYLNKTSGKTNNLSFVLKKLFKGYTMDETLVLEREIKNNFIKIKNSKLIYLDNLNNNIDKRRYFINLFDRYSKLIFIQNSFRKTKLSNKIKNLFDNNITKIGLPLIISVNLKKQVQLNIRNILFEWKNKQILNYKFEQTKKYLKFTSMKKNYINFIEEENQKIKFINITKNIKICSYLYLLRIAGNFKKFSKLIIC